MYSQVGITYFPRNHIKGNCDLNFSVEAFENREVFPAVMCDQDYFLGFFTLNNNNQVQDTDFITLQSSNLMEIKR